MMVADFAGFRPNAELCAAWVWNPGRRCLLTRVNNLADTPSVTLRQDRTVTDANADTQLTRCL